MSRPTRARAARHVSAAEQRRWLRRLIDVSALRETGIAIVLARLRREDPRASDRVIDRRLDRWLDEDLGSETGRVGRVRRRRAA